ncbi:DNA topoisomerase I, catalytic core, eukaryotic-type [Dillenia turbinata]|uniref:DNA topoisomerase I n=1 Tax=Dillenia turbinata TaxID=194707 RepID=A0AAN8UFI1_9MAGN
MSVQACSNPVFDEDDDGPIIFKKSTTVSKQNKSNSEVKKSSCQKNDGQSERKASNVCSPSGLVSISQNNKAPSPKPSLVKSPVTGTKASTSSGSVSPVKSPITGTKASTSGKVSPLKSPVVSSKTSVSAADQSKQSIKQNIASVKKEEKHLVRSSAELDSGSDDSEDDKPLSSRLFSGLLKGSSNNVSKGTIASPGSSMMPKSKLSLKRSSDDSDDEKPLSSKFQVKPHTAASASKLSDDEDEKPLASRLQLNGSSAKVAQPGKSNIKDNKRPLDAVSSPGQSSVKRPKVESSIPTKVKSVSVKSEPKLEDDDHIPIAQRMKKDGTGTKPLPTKQKVTKFVSTPPKKTIKKTKKVTKTSKYSKSTKVPPSSGEGQKWTTLVHNGVIFPPPYKPHGVKMLYKGEPVDLKPEEEEVATMFAVMKDTDYATKEKFIENFMTDWKKILGKDHIIKEFKYCDFTPIYEWHQREKEKKKQMTSEEKKALKEEKLKQEEKYMWAIVDGIKEKVGNFRVEPPGLFRGRGEHPKMGKLKKRILPSDITINIGKDAPVPECPVPGQSWKEVKHDNTVTWLAFWNDPINPREFKYVFLAASSSLKGQSDKEKYEKARKLKDYIHTIRVNYTKDFTSKDVTKRQIAVATYLIDKLALRAGNEKDDDEADTVGCCTLKVENVNLIPPNSLEFDFLGKDSIKYHNIVEVEPPVYKAIGQFKTGKSDGDDIFDKLDTSKLNAHLKELMPGLTAKVFRTYNASITLDEMLHKETQGGDVPEKLVVYNHANKEVAIICNHQRSVSKSHSAQMSRLTEKINELKGVLDGLKVDLSRAKKGKAPLKDANGKPKKSLAPEVLGRKIAQTNAKIEKMERDMQTKEDLKTVALGTSKINYLDPRISVAWCKRHEVPIEKIFNKSLLAKFAWAMDVAPSFRF